MPLSNKQLGNTFIQGQNIIIYPSGNSYVISKPDTESYGATGVVGAGQDSFPEAILGVDYFVPIYLFQDLSGPNSTMIYKSFSAGTGIGIIDSNNTLIFTAITPTINGLTSFTSAGTGNILLLSTAITSNTLFYKTLSGTSNLSVNDDNNGTLTFSFAGSGAGTIISGINIGTGVDVFTGLSTTTNPNDTLAFRNLLAGPNITIATSVDNDGDILISRGSPTLVNQISNIGDGTRVLSSITTTRLLAARTISGANGFTSSNPASPTIVRLVPTNTTASRLYISDATSQLTTNANFGADTTSGSLSIGAAVSTTSRLLIAAGTAAISQIRLTAFSAATSLIDGDIWYSTSGNTLKFYKNNISTDFIFKDNNYAFSGVSNAILLTNTAGNISQKYINSFGLFNALSSVTISNTTSETSTISPVLTGSTTLFASTNAYNPELGIGRKYRFSARGILGSDVPPVNLNIRIKLDSTIISSSSTITIGAIDPISLEFDIESTFTVRNSGLIVGSGKMIFSAPPSDIGGNPVIFGIYSQNATIDTTSNKVFDCTAQLDVADPTNFITIYESTLEILN